MRLEYRDPSRENPKRRTDLCDFTLPQSFWKLFFKDYWGRKPLVIRQPFQRPIITPHEILKALPKSLHRLRSDPGAESRLELGKQELAVQDYGKWFPKPTDQSFASYMKRVEGLAGPRSVRPLAGSVGDIYSDVGRNSWDRIRAFLKGFNDEGKNPLSFASLHVFWGNNPSSFQGVHRDIFDVFCFLLYGKKRFRLWPAEYFRLSIEDRVHRYKKYLKDSLLLEGEPGDILYWPKSYWHVGEIESGSAMSLSLLMASGGGLSASRNLELRSASSFFKIFPPQRKPPLQKRQWIQVNPLLPVLHKKLGKSIRIAASGNSFDTSNTPSLRRLLRQLNSGRWLSVQALLRQASNPEECQKTLDNLNRYGAFAIGRTK